MAKPLPVDVIRSAKLEAALDRAVATSASDELFNLLVQSSGLPGPTANLGLARALGLALARHGGRADGLMRVLVASDAEYARIVAALALAARSLAGIDPRGALAGLQEIAGDQRRTVRSGVVEALRLRLRALGEAEVVDLSAWMDGYLQAHVALEALADRDLLAALPSTAPVLARLDEAFMLADASSRASDRSQGVRTLRQQMPGQIAAFAVRFPETIDWLERAAKASRPETREVVEVTIQTLRKKLLSDADAQRLTKALAASAPLQRNADQVIHGTRKRSKGRT